MLGVALPRCFNVTIPRIVEQLPFSRRLRPQVSNEPFRVRLAARNVLDTFKQTHGSGPPYVEIAVSLQALYGVEGGLELGDFVLNHQLDKVAGELSEMDVKRFFVVERIHNVRLPSRLERGAGSSKKCHDLAVNNHATPNAMLSGALQRVRSN